MLLGAKNRTDFLRVIRQMRLSAGAAMREAFPGDLKRYALPNLPASTLSKARLAYVCCPFFRAALCILALRVGGADRARAQQLVDWLQGWVNRLWPQEETPTPKQLAQAEQELDAAEDLAQTEYLLGIAGARERWLDLLTRRHALDPQLIRSLQMEGGAP